MPQYGIFFGGILTLIGAVGYAYGVAMGSASLTAFIPSAIGVLLFGLGFAARQNEGPRRHIMHAAVVVAILGLGAMVGRLISKRDFITGSAGDIATILTAIVCLIFVILSVRTFMSARAERIR
ncbi:MAG: hypothetical protein WKF34_10105 [Pyrinomonadaceae bacterium]